MLGWLGLPVQPDDSMVKMTEPQQRGEIKLGGAWSDASQIEQVFVDELQIQDIGDRCYITFGQVRLPDVEASKQSGAKVEIRPVVRLIVTKAALTKMLNALNAMPSRQTAGS